MNDKFEMAVPEAKQSYLAQLTEEQAITHDLITTLENKLDAVLDHEPTEGSKALDERSTPHISTNVQVQRNINSRLRYISRTLAL